MSQPFTFKQFTIHQDQCAMKIGTDGVLLGAWASVKHNPNSILDVGSGTGVISLMLAQRSTAKNIEAIEVDEKAYEQCVDNFENSPWGDRLFCYHAGFDELIDDLPDGQAGAEEQYDLIVSNPPFYEPPLTPPKGENTNQSRQIARFYDSLPFNELLEGVAKLLSENGIFATIIPHSEEANFIKLAATFKLFPTRICNVKGTPNSKIKRSLLEFGFEETKTIHKELTVELERHIYTPEYIELTKAFYLKM